MRDKITVANARLVDVPTLAIDALLHPDGVRSLRGRIERRVVATLCEYLSDYGWTPEAVDGGDNGPEACTDTKSAMELVFNLDDSAIAFGNGSDAHRVFIVLGNGEDCISNWGYRNGDPDGFNARMEAFMDLIPSLV